MLLMVCSGLPSRATWVDMRMEVGAAMFLVLIMTITVIFRTVGCAVLALARLLN